MRHPVPLMLFALLLAALFTAPSRMQSSPEDVPFDQLPLGLQRSPEDIAAMEAQFVGLPSIDSLLPPLYLPQADGTAAISHYVIPQTIKVGITRIYGCSAWLNAGQPIEEIIEIPFDDYAKQVLPNEWIHTWEPEALRAGAVAVKTFGWWRINITTLYPGVYRPEGVHVVDNTCDQVFIQNSYRESTDAAVDATWPYRMTREGLIRNIHYLDTDARCDATPILRPCMGQWGTQNMAEDGASWEEILTHYYAPIEITPVRVIPPNTNVVSNPRFRSGLAAWQTFGDVAGLSTEGAQLRFYRPSGSTQTAVVFQDMDYQAYTGTPVQVKLRLGNTSDQDKRVAVHLHHVDDWVGALSCEFTLAANSPPLTYTLRGLTADAWRALRLEIHALSADSAPAYVVDRAVVKHLPDMDINALGCELPTPGRPKFSTPQTGAVVPFDFDLTLQAGRSNYRVGYNPQYRLQIATDPDFASLLSTVEGPLNAQQQTLRVDLSASGADLYYLRAQQSDGMDLSSKWSKTLTLDVRDFPDEPTLLRPAGTDVEGAGLVFAWTDDPTADSYRLVVKDSQKTRVLRQDFNRAQANCDGATCGVALEALPASLVNDEAYRWKVRAQKNTEKTKSRNLRFSAVIPGTPTLSQPPNEAELSSTIFDFAWADVPAADDFRVKVRLPDRSRLKLKGTRADFACADDGLCSVSASELGINPAQTGLYRWNVRARQVEPLAKLVVPKFRFTLTAP